MNFLSDPGRKILVEQILDVQTPQQVHDARAALRAWRERYPEDWGILDAGEELSHFEDAVAAGEPLFGLPSSWTEWQRLEYKVMGARTLPAIQSARAALRQWAAQHPSEPEPGYLEMLFLLLDVVEEQQSGKSEPQARPEREPAGQAA